MNTNTFGDNDKITLTHGSGGQKMHELIRDIFGKRFGSHGSDDAAVLEMPAGKLAFTTDSFVVSPIFFAGGNIGKLAVCGTVNDLATSGAIPVYMSCGFIIEEGFPIAKLDEIATAMAETASECGVRIVTGDTKVVQKGAADGVFINTSGVGAIPDGVTVSGSLASAGDTVIISGTIGEHGSAILLEREKLGIRTSVKSDCAPLSGMTSELIAAGVKIHTFRDPTRGGLATTLNEIAAQSGTSIVLSEKDIPVSDEVRGICGLLGLDPLYLACEGRMIVIVPAEEAGGTLEILRRNKYGAGACIIGQINDAPAGRVSVKTLAGGHRVADMIQGEQLPRIC
jgi:hydrogenase expression/formation protein HypE